ncbi:NIMA-interacting protein TinC [Histoplasma capsulatum G186AR]|uniref:NIMA-interacting protein TinC n=1 Tax=Ajellomyces capsulatus TaxID=5037 RepID=A0A8H7YA69_AJECA|nr:NIMA-interacting protein TinC [Histoplasma capsulatum]QSS71275.1 NIMA-interacting protein TinC [Histoplasma capsulatum G186AR]
MAWSTTTTVALTCVLFLLFTRPVHAFGAGNIASVSKIEGQNWRHGDIEDAILTLMMARSAGGKKFSKLQVQRIYFGNWLRDYSQALDIGTLKYVSAEAIRLLLWVLGFMTFGYGTGEFEVTLDRVGCYQPTEHIDNPLGYGEGQDARRYYRRLRGPVDEERELGIDARTGLKNYIASEDLGIDNSASLLRKVFGNCIELGRRYSRSRRDADLYEALRLLGTGLHTLEDYLAHSNYTELSLIELGETNVFPHVGRNTMIQLQGARNSVYPIVTGTFGGVDFLHSVMGEITDKATQSEIQNLEGMIEESENQKPQEGFLQVLLDKIPEGLLGSEDNTEKMNEFQSNAESTKRRNENISPREPEQWATYMNDVQQQMFPLLEWHDNLIKSINSAIEKIPAIPELVEQVQEQITIFVFSVMAPYVLPILKQVKTELETGSSEVIQSSKEGQFNTFNNDRCTDPTHSMLSKDHFSNLLNEPAGKAASEVVKWVVPQIMECWDDENIDVNRTMNRIINGVFHHPALRQYGEDGSQEMRRTMFGVIESWWNEQGRRGQDSLRQQLSREGVRNGDNHKPGVHDSGHGCGKPMGLPNRNRPVPGGVQDMLGLQGLGGNSSTNTSNIEKMASEAVGGGLIGSLVGGIVGGATSGTFEGPDDGKRHKEKKEKDHHSDPYYHSSYSKDKDYEKEEKKKKKDKEEKWDKDKKHEKKDKDKKDKKDKYKDEDDKDKDGKKDKKDKKADKDKKYKESKKYNDGDGYRRDDRGGGGYESGRHQSGEYGQPQYAETGGYGRSEERHDRGSSGGYGAGGYGGYSGGYGGENRGYGEKDSSGYGGGYGGGESRGYGGSETRGYGDSESRGYGGGYGDESRGGYGYQQESERSSHQHRERSGSRERASRRYESGHYGSDDRRHGSRERSRDRRRDDDDDDYRRRYKKDDDDYGDEGSNDGYGNRHQHKHSHHRRDS